jgi:hypothetical protein
MSLGRRARSGKTTPTSREATAKAEETRAAETTKIARLRALRLAKEAADRDALAAPLPRNVRSTQRPANDAT